MKIPLLILALTVCAWSLSAVEGTAITNSANTAASLTETQLKDIYLGRKTTWDDGSRIVVVFPESGDGNTALLKILGKSSSQFTTSWKKLVFSGQGTMPTTVKERTRLRF